MVGSGTKYVIPSNAEVINVLGLDGNHAPQVLPMRARPSTETRE